MTQRGGSSDFQPPTKAKNYSLKAQRADWRCRRCQATAGRAHAEPAVPICSCWALGVGWRYLLPLWVRTNQSANTTKPVRMSWLGL